MAHGSEANSLKDAVIDFTAGSLGISFIFQYKTVIKCV